MSSPVRHPALRRASLLIGALAALCAASRAQAPVGGEAARFVELLVRRAECPAAGNDGAADELAQAPEAVAAYLAVASGRELPATPGGESRPLGPAESDLLAQVSLRLPAEDVMAHVRTALGHGPDDAWRAAALGLLAVHARAADLGLLIDIVSEDPGTESGAGREQLLCAFRTAMTELLERDGDSFEQLAFSGAVSADVGTEIVRALGAAGDPRGLSWLVESLRDADLRTVSLQELGRLAPRARDERALAAAEAVRPLLGAEEAIQRRCAIGILADLEDFDCIPRLIEILAQAEGSERVAAHDALLELSRRRLPADASLWLTWYGEEQRWWDERSAAVLEDLASESPTVVLDAVRALSERSLHREELAAELARIVGQHPMPSVRAQACAGLARLGSRRVTSELAAALDDRDPAVRTQALQALKALTGARGETAQ